MGFRGFLPLRIMHPVGEWFPSPKSVARILPPGFCPVGEWFSESKIRSPLHSGRSRRPLVVPRRQTFVILTDFQSPLVSSVLQSTVGKNLFFFLPCCW